ncbi:hypothetical protein BH10BDE1_BH10BDE1_09870 [soil metagenome]
MAQLKKPNFSLRQHKTQLARVRDIARNTASAAEFIVETVRAETRHLAHIAVAKVTTRLTGHVHKPYRDGSLDPLGGVAVHSAGVMDDPLSRLS